MVTGFGWREANEGIVVGDAQAYDHIGAVAAGGRNPVAGR
jgi:hypothetical protein